MMSITIDDNVYEIDETNEVIKQHMANIQTVNELIVLRNNELQVAETAKIGYSRALKREIQKLDNTWMSLILKVELTN